ncbi:MAG: RluA family pseudouridine synthase, partial [Spirochaetes bacterium]|nr:RluA family pseudouridine synthase [Spirochaetota bacterium]
MKLTTGEDDSGRRLDRVLRKALPDCPLALLHRFLRKGLVSVDGRPQEGGFRVNAGSVISVPSLSGGRGVSPSKPRSPLPPPEILWQGRG